MPRAPSPPAFAAGTASMPFGELYLANPALLPARLAGEPWGGERLVVDLPGGPFAFSGLTPWQSEALAHRWSGFICTNGEPAAVETLVARVAPEEFCRFDLRGFELTLEAVHSETAVQLVGYETMARLEWRSGGVRGAIWTSAEDPGGFAGAVENYFRALVAYRLAECDAVLLHAAAVVHDGAAYVFCGPSGAGKTTLARLCAASGDVVSSDDLVAVALRADGALALPLPFCGDLRAPQPPAPQPVAALCRLRQAPATAAQRLGPAAGVAALSACAPYLNRDPYRLDALLARLASCVALAPVLELELGRSTLPWDALAARGLAA